MRNLLHLGHLRVVQAGGDQQHAVGAHHTRFVDLIGVDHEILAQHRQQRARAGLLEIVGLPLEELAIGQHRQAGSTDLAIAHHIALGDIGGIEIGSDHALAGAGLLDFGDHAGLSLGNLGTDGAHEIARGDTALRIAAHLGKRHGLLGGSNFLDLDVADFLENVRHGFPCWWRRRARPS
ncbi:hypothetical protein SDC9_159193 [bioreactor metagenome]|uniref:Uncharacterized protein n=1 Tax=bioreactor metagenome TaxID=1076179 RepID=A0A645FHC6_9ZZZZ